MPKASPLRSSFNAGELSPLMDGRPDVAKYANGCKELTNFIPSVQGPAVRRAGTRFVSEVKDSTKQTWLARFEFSVDQVFILEFGEYYVRFYTERGTLLNDAGTALYEKLTPYSAADLVTSDGTFKLSMVQSGDIIYIAHPDYPLYRLSRYNNTNWTMDIAPLKNGPFKDQNLDKRVTMYASTTTNAFVVNPSFIVNLNGWTLTAHNWTEVTYTYSTFSGVTFKFPNYKTVSSIARRAGGFQNNGRMAFYNDGTSSQAAQTLTGLTVSTVYTVTLRTEGKVRLKIGTTAGASNLLLADVTPSSPGAVYTPPGGSQSASGSVTTTYTFTASATTAYITLDNVIAANNTYSYVDEINVGGAVTVTASESLFTANMVGSLLYMEPSDLSTIKPWLPGEEFVTNPFGLYRRSDGKTYICTSTGTPTTTSVWRTGGDKPIHTYGTQSDGGGGGKTGTNVSREGLDWKYVDSGYAILKITTYISSTAVFATATTDWSLPTNMGSATPTFRWAFGAFSAGEGYPSNVTFFRERLTLSKGQNLYFSVAGDFENFASKNDSGDVVLDRAINVQLSSDEVNTVQWLAPQQSLLIGTAGYEFACSENSVSEAFGPGNVKIEQQTSFGSKSVRAARVGYSTLFMQRCGRKLKELAYSFQQNGYVSTDMTVLAEHITQGGVTQVAWHKEPYVCLWCIRSDGVLLGFTFNKEQDVLGWHKHVLGGGGIVESLTVVPSPNKDRDDLWMIVRRTINGVSKRYVEYLTAEYKTGDAQASAFYVDCGLTYSGTAATTISGLSHLEGQTVQILADGAAHPDRVVTGGAVTLQVSASTVNIGLGYNSNVQTNRIEAGAGDGTAQGKMKRINKVVVRFFNTLGAKAGPDADHLDTIVFRTGSDPMDKAPPLFTGDKLVEWPDGYNFDGYIYIRQDQPLPMTVISIMPQVTTFDR